MLLRALDRVYDALGDPAPGRPVKIDFQWSIEGVTILETTTDIAEVPLGEVWHLTSVACHATTLITVPFHHLQENGRFRFTWQCDQSGILGAADMDRLTDVTFDPGSVITVRSVIPAALGLHAGDAYLQFAAVPA